MVLYLCIFFFLSVFCCVHNSDVFRENCTYQFLLFMNDCHANAKDVFTHDQFDVNHSWHSLGKLCVVFFCWEFSLCEERNCCIKSLKLPLTMVRLLLCKLATLCWLLFFLHFFSLI